MRFYASFVNYLWRLSWVGGLNFGLAVRAGKMTLFSATKIN